MTLFLIALCTAIGAAFILARWVLVVDRWAEREREKTEWHIVQRYRRKEMER